MNRTCSVFLFLFCAVVVAGRKLHESPEKCAGPFDVSNTMLYRTGGIGTGRGCDTFRAKELPMDEALGLIVRLASPPTSNASLFDLQKEIIGATLAPSKACLLENWEGHGRRALLREPCFPGGCIGTPTTEESIGGILNEDSSSEGSNPPGTRFPLFPFFPFFPLFPGFTPPSSGSPPGGIFGQGIGRRRRQLMMMTTQGEEGEDGEDARGRASDGLETGEVGDGEAAFTACNARCCVSLLVKEKDVDTFFEASAN